MEDGELRGWAVRWVNSVGRPWSTADNTPVAGSDLALDDAGMFRVSPIACFGVLTAIDHLSFVVDSMMIAGLPKQLYAPLTTLRTALLASARVKWMLAPDDTVERQLRCLQVRFVNAREQRKALNAFADGRLEPESELDRAAQIAALDEQIQTLQAHAVVLGARQLNEPPDTVSMLRDHLVDTKSPQGMAIEFLWRKGSASAHGYHWDDLQNPGPLRFNEPSFNLALYGAFGFVDDARTLYVKRAAAPTK